MINLVQAFEYVASFTLPCFSIIFLHFGLCSPQFLCTCHLPDHIYLVIGCYIFTPLFFKWLSLNHFPSVCECHSLSLLIKVKQFSVLTTTGFPFSIIKHEWSSFLWRLGGHLCFIVDKDLLKAQIMVQICCHLLHQNIYEVNTHTIYILLRMCIMQVRCSIPTAELNDVKVVLKHFQNGDIKTILNISLPRFAYRIYVYFW